MILTKEEKENQVIDLYFNEKKPYRYISQIVRMSLRDISSIIKKEEQKRAGGSPSLTNTEANDKQQPFITEVSAYKLFSEGKDPVQVAIELNITQQDVTLFQRGFWKMKQLDQLNQISVAMIKFKNINKDDAKIRYADEQRKKSISSDRIEIVEAGLRAEQYLNRQFSGQI